MNIPIILGTAREGRQSEKVAKFVLTEAKRFGFKTEIIDVRNFRIPATDNTKKLSQAKKLAKKIIKADGLVIVSPEYNHSYPGELKMMLDMLYGEFVHKPFGICGVSAGNLGGARMVEQLRLVGIEFHMVPIREAVYFPVVQDLFDKAGKIKDESYKYKLKIFFDELNWYTKALK